MPFSFMKFLCITNSVLFACSAPCASVREISHNANTDYGDQHIDVDLSSKIDKLETE